MQREKESRIARKLPDPSYLPGGLFTPNMGSLKGTPDFERDTAIIKPQPQKKASSAFEDRLQRGGGFS